ncbi:YgaP-like transmembrane domain [Benzoatithermus flavus]|uniref:Inner membrane protein YgaP-like transmembrane domain-containing protein n=1 Tax=Benzoatithermus flavus TaxID=3108223 RepID=A0ABU8XV52_9PROT
MMPATSQRVPLHTAAHVNAWIAAQTRDSVAWHARHPETIDRRLEELDAEWDIERMLEANAASVALAGLALAAWVDRRWLALPIGVAAFLLQHAIQGWCPPVEVFRRLGFRTAREIDEERYALKALRGDFEGLGRADGGDAQAALAATRH